MACDRVLDRRGRSAVKPVVVAGRRGWTSVAGGNHNVDGRTDDRMGCGDVWPSDRRILPMTTRDVFIWAFFVTALISGSELFVLEAAGIWQGKPDPLAEVAFRAYASTTNATAEHRY